MSSAPIRQPRGPPSSTAAFSGGPGSPAPATSPGPAPTSSSPSPSRGSTSTGPPPPDAESILRRNKTVSTGARAAAPGFEQTPSGVSLSHRRSFGSSGASAYPSSNQVTIAHADSKPSSGFVVASRYRSSSGSYSGGGLGHAPGSNVPGVGAVGGMSGVGVGVPPVPAIPTGVVGGSLTRRTSGRDFRATSGVGGAEETLLETESWDEHASTATERGTWGKGLSRQSSLPSRRLVTNGGVNPGLFTPSQLPPEPAAPNSSNNPPPPPRPPRRVYHPSVDQGSPSSPPVTSGGHSRSSSHSLSLSMSNVGQYAYDGSSVNSTPASAGHGSNAGFPTTAAGGGVSRTQSLRAHMQSQPPPVEYSNLGRSASMRAPGELTYSRMHASPPPPHPFSVATPPRPTKSTLPYGDEELEPTGEIRRHQSLTYGASARTRERLERSQALLSLDQREDLRRRLAASPGGASASPGATNEGRRHSRHLSIGMEDSPSNPMGRSVWAPGGPAPGDDGWSSSAALQDALESLSIQDRDHANAQAQARQVVLQHPGDEPSWVTNLVGMPGQPSPQASQRPLGHWDDRAGPGQYSGLPPQWAAGGQLQAPLTVYQQQQLYAQAQAQAQLKLAAAGLGGGPVPVLPQMPMGQGYPLGAQGYLGAPFTPSYAPPPPTGPIPSPAGPPLSAQDLDVLELARSKGLNPATFDCHPPSARFFVIKSYTEDDVQKSLKHGIWSSTVLGNKRLDAAYRESHERGPIYLFFSVNGSRHFCGVAQMTSPVDETQSSNVWAQDKWKGIFSVRWIFVRDISNLALRHIRLNNTPERKPITNTRDTTEVPYENGCEVLQIFLDHQHKSKTSLLQDFAYYERLSATRDTTASPQPQVGPHSGHATPTPPMPYGQPHTPGHLTPGHHTPGMTPGHHTPGLMPGPALPAAPRV